MARRRTGEGSLPRPRAVERGNPLDFPGADLSAEAVEFGRAMHRYQRATGRQFPGWSEVLAVLKSLGYRRVPPSPDSGDVSP